MDENTIIEQLEELIKSFGIQIRHEAIKQDEDLVNVVGGLCLLRGEYVLIINSKATTMDRIKTLATALKHFDLDQIYLRPVLRELLDKTPEQRPFHSMDKQNLKDSP
jgi:N-dimethylarginine dimethylaminohydrolase